MEHEKSDIYERITAQIVEAIEAGAEKFCMPWHVTGADPSAPVSAASRKAYRGVNVISLWATAWSRGYSSGIWATYQQWQQLGGQVRKGERSAPVVFWKFPDRKSDEIDEPTDSRTSRGVLARGYSVFNAEQVDGYSPPAAPTLPESTRLAKADEFFVLLGPNVRCNSNRACYVPAEDIIELPPFGSFRNAAGYYSTLAHESAHWTGAAHRLNRNLESRFGSDGYAMEELVAELGAAFLCSTLGISNAPRPDHAAYIGSWLTVLKHDKRAIFTAASLAQKAADWMTTRSAELPPGELSQAA